MLSDAVCALYQGLVRGLPEQWAGAAAMNYLMFQRILPRGEWP
jgi:hypothetical protein